MSDVTIEITKTRHIGKGALLGCFGFYDKARDIYVNDCCLFKNKQGDRFVTFPQRSWKKESGEYVNSPVFLFGKESSNSMKQQLFQALEAYRIANHCDEELREETPQYKGETNKQFKEEDLPF